MAVLVVSAAIRPFVRGRQRALPPADAGDVAGRDSPARAAKDGVEHLASPQAAGDCRATAF